jgi:hypothetical protein
VRWFACPSTMLRMLPLPHFVVEDKRGGLILPALARGRGTAVGRRASYTTPYGAVEGAARAPGGAR